MSEFVVAGLLITPFVKFALIALVLYLPLRLLLTELRLQRFVWHPLLSEAGLYVCLLALLSLFV